MELPRRSRSQLLLALRWLAVLAPGYIHPDEFFQAGVRHMGRPRIPRPISQTPKPAQQDNKTTTFSKLLYNTK